MVRRVHNSYGGDNCYGLIDVEAFDIELLATYQDREELHREFPGLESQDIQQALIFRAFKHLKHRI